MRELIHIPEDIQRQLEDLLKDGRVLSAWQIAQPYGDLKQWAPGQSRFIASWIASGAGAERLSRSLDWLNWRSNRLDPKSYFHALFPRLTWKAPALLLPEVRAKTAEFGPKLDAKTHSDLLSFQAWCLGTLREFPAAHEAMQQALALTPDRAWTHVQHSGLLEMEDRYEEALEAALPALSLRHFYRPAVMQAVDCLVHLGRDDQAVELLHHAHDQTELGAFATRLQVLYSEREDHQKALWCLSQAEQRMPLMPETTLKWLAGRRADFLYQAGDFDGCLEWCDKKGEGFQKRLAENLRRPGARERKRVRLDVPFIRQHNMTCAPATLASLAKYWGRDHEHLAIADAICYDGTPWHKERGWAESNGYIAREFRFTREILIALIDRGIPFTLTTSAVTSAHMQACIGYDDRQDIVLLRDPTHRHFGEMLIKELIEDHPVQGPRCMLLLPREEAARLDGLILPDEFLFEAYHRLSGAMEMHDRWKAEEAASGMRAIAPDHPLTISAQGELASYLGHRSKHLEIVEKQVARFPDFQPLLFQKLGVLRSLGDLEGARTLLKSAVEKKSSDPVFVSEFGELLLQDARQLPLAGHFLRRALRLQRGSGRPLESLARWHDKLGKFPESARLRRHAATLSKAWEGYSRAYFDSCRTIGRTTEALDFLKTRLTDLGRTKSDPWLTYARCLDMLRRSKDARAVLEQAVTNFPDDGPLRLQAGRMMIAWGEADRTLGLRWIEEARGKVADTHWLRQRASAAIYVGDRTSAIRLWRLVIDQEPLAMDAYQTLPRLIAEEQGEPEALAFLEDAARKHPRQPVLWGLLAQRRTAPAEILEAFDRTLALDPDDNWARRERAGKRFEAGDREGGLADAREALERDAGNPESHGTLASLLHDNGQPEEAIARVKEALRLSIDYTFAINRLIYWTHPKGQAAQEAALGEIEAEMRRQVSNGDCVPEYQGLGWRILPPPGLLARLQEFCRERPDLWQTWSARIAQALRMDLLAEADTCATHLQTVFPLLPRTWMEVAKVRHAQGDFPGEVEALQKAVDLSPAWDSAAIELSTALERLNRFDEAEAVLKRAIHHDPLNCAGYGFLADLYLKRNKLEEAYAQLAAAVGKSPFYTWGWITMGRLSVKLDRVEPFLELLRSKVASHGGNVRWWVTLTEIYQGMDRTEDMLEAARAGLRIDPAHVELIDLYVVALCEQGQFDEALAACDPAPTREIEGRRAWALMESGDAPAAIRAIRGIVAREPDYSWAWQQLATWLGQRNDWPGLAEAAKQWTRLSPNQSAAHGHVALAAQEMGNADLARRAYERAFLLDPEYRFAGRRLLHLQKDAGDFSGAQTTLATLRHYAADIWIECDAILLALHQKNDALALEMAGHLCKEATNGEALIWLNQEFNSRHLTFRWRQQMERLIKEGAVTSPALLAAWADLARTMEELTSAAKQLRKFKIDETARNAAWEILLRAAQKTQNLPLLDVWLRKERSRFYSDPDLWNTTGELLLLTGKYKEAIRWLGSWETRGDATGSHTLVNLSAALDALKGPAAAEAVRSAGIVRFRGEPNALSLRAAQASYLGAKGDVDQAEGLLAPVEDSSLSGYYLGLASLGRAVVSAAARDEVAAETHYRTAVEKLGGWPGDPAVRNHFVPAQKALAERLTWTRGSAGKLAKAWGSAVPRSTIFWDRMKTVAIISGLAIIALAIAGFISPLAVIPGITILAMGLTKG